MPIGLLTICRNTCIAAQEPLLDKYFPNDERIPLLDIALNNTNLVLYSGHQLIDGVRPTMPQMQYLGTIHCKKAQPLPEDLEQFMRSSGDNGVIVVSFGSYIKSTYMEKHVLSGMVKVFGELKQNVIWKWENDTLEDRPENVLVRKWLPQQDLLGHAKTKLFVTHSGQSSIQETLCHKVPVVGFIHITDFSSYTVHDHL